MKFLIVIFALPVVMLGIMPVYAAEPLQSPESIAISDVKVFRNLAEDGDALYVFQYDIAYASDNYPTTVASDSFIFRLYDQAEELQVSTSPYVYPFFYNNGYGEGVSSFYFSASDSAPAWGSSVSINIYGSPAYFNPAETFSYDLTSDDYVTVTTQEDNREECYNFVLLLADRLSAAYADTGIVLKTSSDSGIVLSSYGELYFRGTIEGLQNLCPDLFFVQVYVPEKMATSYDMSLQSTYTERLSGGDLDKGFTRIGQAIGISKTFAAALIFIVLMIAVCVMTVKKGWGIEPGLGISALIGVFAAIVVGSVIFTIIMITSLIAAVGLVYIVILKRA